MLFLRLLLRALRWRAAASFAVFLVAVVAVLAAVIGPVYLAAAARVVLTDRLAETPASVLDLTITRNAAPLSTADDLRTDVRQVGADAAKTPFFGPVVVSESTQLRFTSPRKVAYQARLGAVDDQCAHLRFTAGSCPTAFGQVALSARSAAKAGFEVGDKVAVATVNDGYPFTFQITALYEPVDAHGAFWRPFGFFDQRNALYQGQRPFLDTFVVDPATITHYIQRISVSVRGVAALQTDAVGPADEGTLRRIVGAAQASASAVSQDQLYKTVANSGLPGRLDTVDHELDLTRTLVDLATVQLAVLAICVLYAIVSATATAHGGEVALAKLRGRRSAGTLAQGLAEPVALVLLAAPVGALLARLAVGLIAPHTLGPVAVDFPAAALLVAVLTAAAAVVAAGLAARRIVTAPVGALLRRGGTETESSKVGLLVADAAALAIALAGLFQLVNGGVLTRGKANALSALAPTLLAVAVGIVGLRLLPYAARAVIAATRESRRLAPYLAVRQILRRANSTRLALLVAVALALATLAVTTWSVAGTNRDIRALTAVGANEVLTVTTPAGLDLDVAVDRADPDGHDALAAEVLPVNSTQMLAVQARRLPGIAAWRDDFSSRSLSSIIDTIDPRLPPALTVTGGTVAVELQTETLTRGVPLTAQLLVVQPNHIQATVALGRLRVGDRTYRAQLPPGCRQSCRVSQLALSTPASYTAPFDSRSPRYHPTFHAVLASISGQGQRAAPAAAYFSDGKSWRQGGIGGSLDLLGAPAGLDIDASPDPGTSDWPVLVADDVPDHLPAAVAASTAALYPGDHVHDLVSVGLDGSAVDMDGQAITAILPRLGKFGTMVDLSLAYAKMTGLTAAGVQQQVWLAAGAPVDAIEAALTKQGVAIVSTDRAATQRAELDHSGPAYADTVFLIAALAATILAIGGAVLAALVTARRRSYELAALEAIGVRPRTLRRASALEQGLLIGLGVLFGIAAGIGGSALALPSTPIFVDPDAGPPLEYALPWTLLLTLVGGLVVVLVALCMVMARAVEGQAKATRLREAAA